jgi:hypothetical protein
MLVQLFLEDASEILFLERSEGFLIGDRQHVDRLASSLEEVQLEEKPYLLHHPVEEQRSVPALCA